MRAADLDLGVTLVLTPGFYAPAFREKLSEKGS